jgi:hypothetical protein
MVGGGRLQARLAAARHQDLPSFRVLVVDTHPLCPTAASVRNALDQLADRLSRAGAKVARASPLLPDLAEAARVHFKLLTAGGAADLPADAYWRLEAAAKALPADDDSLADQKIPSADLAVHLPPPARCSFPPPGECRALAGLGRTVAFDSRNRVAALPSADVQTPCFLVAGVIMRERPSTVAMLDQTIWSRRRGCGRRHRVAEGRCAR